MPNLSLILTEAAQMYPDRTAIKLDDYVLTYAELDDAAARLAGHLRAEGLAPGDRVGVMLPNVPAFAVVYFGVLRAGGIVVPMNPLLKDREVQYYLGDSGARRLFVWHEFAAGVTTGAEAAGASVQSIAPDTLDVLLADVEPADVVTRATDDTAVILYTSGTTGQPKGAELTHANLGTNAAVMASTLTLVEPEDVILGCLPLFHAFGQTCCLNAAVANGAAITLLPRFDAARAVELIARDRVTIFEGVPTMYSAILALRDQVGDSLATLRLAVSGGAALPVEVLRSFEAAFSCMILEGYGLSETSPVASFNHPHLERKAGSIGTPIEGVELRLIDDSGAEVGAGEVGEIAVRGHNVMKGYWNRPDDTAATMVDGWFKTGDLAKIDEDGYYFIVDRKKSLIIRGGFNVYPREIEEVVYEHPAVAEAAIVGVPHPSLGEEIGAAVVLRPGATASAEELRAFVKERVAAYKYPRHVWFMEALPKGPTGKIMRREIEIPSTVSPS